MATATARPTFFEARDELRAAVDEMEVALAACKTAERRFREALTQVTLCNNLDAVQQARSLPMLQAYEHEAAALLACIDDDDDVRPSELNVQDAKDALRMADFALDGVPEAGA